MINKTDKFLKRKVAVYDRGYVTFEEVFEIFRKETWWLLWIIPIYSKDTVIKSQNMS